MQNAVNKSASAALREKTDDGRTDLRLKGRRRILHTCDKRESNVEEPSPLVLSSCLYLHPGPAVHRNRRYRQYRYVWSDRIMMECLSFRTLIVVKSRLRFAIGIPFFIHSVQPPCCTQYSYSSRNINTRYLSFHPHSSLNSLTHSLAQSQQPRCTHSHLCSFVEHAHIYYATSTAGGNNSRLEDYMRLLCELFFLQSSRRVPSTLSATHFNWLDTQGLPRSIYYVAASYVRRHRVHIFALLPIPVWRVDVSQQAITLCDDNNLLQSTPFCNSPLIIIS